MTRPPPSWPAVCAFLAPEPIPEDLFTSAPGELPGELAARAADPLAWRQTLAHLARQSLARIDQRGLVMHRLTQAILRDRLRRGAGRRHPRMYRGHPGRRRPRDADNPVTWPRWAQLMPHLLAADLAATGSRGLRWMACNACLYLLARGDTRAPMTWPATSPALARPARRRPRKHAGRYALRCLGAAGHGPLRRSPRLDEDTLARTRRVRARTIPIRWPTRPTSPTT